jgi:hypothetical protein
LKIHSNRGRLHVDDQLQSSNGSHVTITAIRDYTTTMVTYDLTINTLHTHYVEAGITPVLVHNDDPTNPWQVPDDYVIVRGGQSDMPGPGVEFLVRWAQLLNKQVQVFPTVVFAPRRRVKFELQAARWNMLLNRFPEKARQSTTTMSMSSLAAAIHSVASSPIRSRSRAG